MLISGDMVLPLISTNVSVIDIEPEADVLPVLFKRKLDLHQTPFAMGEAIAHLHALVAQRRLRALPVEGGVQRFAPLA